MSKIDRRYLFTITFVHFVGGLGPSGRSNYSQPSHESGDPQFSYQRDTRQSTYMAAPYPTSKRIGPWMLHVSN